MFIFTSPPPHSLQVRTATPCPCQGSRDSVAGLSQRRVGFDTRPNPRGIYGGESGGGKGYSPWRPISVFPPAPLSIIWRWSRGLRRRSAVARLDCVFESSRRHRYPVTCECCAGRDLCDNPILRPEKHCPVSVCVTECDQVQQ
jgi:hypothetical protein